MADDIVQIIENARVDATSLSEFMYYPASVTVNRRLAPPIHTLNYYLLYLEGLEKVYSQPTGTVEVNGEVVKTVRQSVNDAIDSAILGDYQTQLEVGLSNEVDRAISRENDIEGVLEAEVIRASDAEATISQDLSDLNLEVDAQKLDTGITATAKFTGFSRKLSDKLLDVLTVNDFIDSSDTDESAAILRMQDAVGYIKFSRGEYVIDNDIVITKAMHFEQGAYLTNNATVDIAHKVSAPDNQWVFRGDGTYNLKHIYGVDNSEDARTIHISWFGAFTQAKSNPADCVDVAPFIQKAMLALGNTRESVVDFSIGNYIMRTPVTVPRGCWLRGAGIRRTVFKTDLDNFDFFTTIETACKFTGIQQENFLTQLPVRKNGYFIVLNHVLCEVSGVAVQADKSIKVSDGANNCKVEDIAGFFGSAITTEDSSIVEVNGASGTKIYNISTPQSTNSPKSLVLIKTTAVNASGTDIRGLNTLSSNPLVKLKATGSSIISRTKINGFNYDAFSGTKNTVLDLQTTDTASIANIVVSEFTVNSYANSLLSANQTSSGSIKNIVVNTGTLEGVGNLISLTRTSGAITDVRVGNEVINTREVVTSGSAITGVTDLSKSTITKSRSVTIATDAVAVIDAPRLYGNSLRIVTNSREYLDAVVRTETPSDITVITKSLNINTVSTPLTGTTGATGKITIGASGGKIYIENRIGTSITVEVTV